MFAHKINQLKNSDKIQIGNIFDHNSKVHKAKYQYEIMDIKQGENGKNDSVTLKLLWSDISDSIQVFDVEPEWFNQRSIMFN